MKEFVLNDEDMLLLKASLLGFVKRVAFQGAEFESEAGDFFLIVRLLLNIPLALELNMDALMKTEESRESENSGEGLGGGTRLLRCFEG